MNGPEFDTYDQRVTGGPVKALGAWAATPEFKLNYLAPVMAGTVAADARIVSMTKRTAVVQIEVTKDGRAVCLAQGTVLVMAPKTKEGA